MHKLILAAITAFSLTACFSEKMPTEITDEVCESIDDYKSLEIRRAIKNQCLKRGEFVPSPHTEY
uniref:entry exclusion lipoprotein TrbK n=1 Tax=Thaumasiovibrio occultus TaxID=1891184 RepID=UPI000B34E477|nr:entry exclusion lipoprotein TrbK [Thaumasiovibrio occultus]